MKSVVVMFSGLVLSCAYHTEPGNSLGYDTPPRPNVAKQFSAMIITHGWMATPPSLGLEDPISQLAYGLWRPEQGLGLGSETSQYFYDSINKLSKTISSSRGGPFLDGCQFNTTSTANATHYFIDGNNQCRQFGGGKFGDVFGWVAVASPNGTKIVEGAECQLWTYTAPDGKFNGSLCAVGDTPVELTLLAYGEFLPGRPASISNTTMTFKSFSPIPPSPDVFSVPEECEQPPTPCDDQGVQVIDMYLAHPSYSYNISGQDTADSLGDALFTCYDIGFSSHESDNYTLVSLYQVRASSQWGQYALCNGYDPSYCVGAETFYVGRESPLGCNAMGGQCGPTPSDPDFVKAGFWYSLPVGGECHDGQSIENGDCTWEILQRVKTIEVSCLFETQGMKEACFQDGGLPFTRAHDVFITAFEESEESKGGCKDIGGP